MAEAPQEDVFDAFFRAFVHSIRDGQPWYEVQNIHTCYAVVQWQRNNGETHTIPVVQSGQGQSVEQRVIQQLDEQMLQMQQGEENTVKITIYMSLSPSANCSDMLIEFKQRTDLDVQMDVIFPSLYNIRRESCLRSPNTCSGHIERIAQENSDNNSGGLRRMAEAGITLRTFTPDDWTTLGQKLHVDNEFIQCLEEIQQEHAAQEHAAQGVLTLNDWIDQAAEQGASPEIMDRLREDRRVASDLRAILHGAGGGAGHGGGAGPGPDDGQGPGDDDDYDPKQAIAVRVGPGRDVKDDPKAYTVEQEEAAATRKLRELEGLPEMTQQMSISTGKTSTKPAKDTK